MASYKENRAKALAANQKSKETAPAGADAVQAAVAAMDSKLDQRAIEIIQDRDQGTRTVVANVKPEELTDDLARAVQRYVKGHPHIRKVVLMAGPNAISVGANDVMKIKNG